MESFFSKSFFKMSAGFAIIIAIAIASIFFIDWFFPAGGSVASSENTPQACHDGAC